MLLQIFITTRQSEDYYYPWGSERLGNSPKVTKPVRGRAGLRPLGGLNPKALLSPTLKSRCLHLYWSFNSHLRSPPRDPGLASLLASVRGVPLGDPHFSNTSHFRERLCWNLNYGNGLSITPGGCVEELLQQSQWKENFIFTTFQ